MLCMINVPVRYRGSQTRNSSLYLSVSDWRLASGISYFFAQSGDSHKKNIGPNVGAGTRGPRRLNDF